MPAARISRATRLILTDNPKPSVNSACSRGLAVSTAGIAVNFLDLFEQVFVRMLAW